ncbi:MAG TPA: response regulator transcription factor, partial [Nitrospira sp.]|nr:response regulator transcription factor [Nitrospira sp.]
MNKIRVLLAEDHTLVRAGFRALLEKLEGIQVIGEVSDGRDALRVCKELGPEVVLMDIAMSGMNGLEATSRMRQECPRTKVLMLTMYTNEEYLKEALRAGASGYLLKDADR